MKLLLDENLSPRPAPRLIELFPEITHVRDVGLRRADDRTIWEWAKRNGYTVGTTDADLLRRNAVRITEFHGDRATGVLAVRV